MREKPLILIVDDEDNFLEIIGTKFRASGFDVDIAHDGSEGIQKSTQLLPDLILMDIHMPGMTGTDAALAIKQNVATKDIKIAFLTSLNDPWPGLAGDRTEASKEMGMADFLRKEDDLDNIVARVRKILAGMPGSTPASSSASSDSTPAVQSGNNSTADPAQEPKASESEHPQTTPSPPADSSADLHL